MRDAVRLVVQELIETEATEQIGAARYERTDTRITERNGSRPRLVATQAGDIELRIPKLRKGSFFPSILEPRRRIDQALYAVVIYDTAHTFLEDHCIRLEIASSNFPVFDRNLNSQVTPALGTEEDAQKAVQQIFHDTDRASCVILPVV